MPHMELLIQTFVHDKNGKLVRKSKKRPSKSFVKAWLQMIERIMAHPFSVAGDAVTVKDTSNTDRALQASTGQAMTIFSTEAPANTDTYGIQIGTGTTAPATADYTIETQIAHGVGAGEMQHGACSVQSAGIVGANMDMVITRAFTNSSGGTIVVKEVGIACQDMSTWYFLITHDAVDDTVLNTETYTVQYTFRTTV